MQKSYSQNNLLGGLSVDKDMVKAEPNTLIDAINATVSPEDGSKLVYQSLKSTVPETSIYQHSYDVDAQVVTIAQQEILTGGIREITFPEIVKMKEVYFVFAASGYDTDLLYGKTGYNLSLSIHYNGDLDFGGNKIYTPIPDINLNFLKVDDVIPITVESDRFIKSIKYEVIVPVIEGIIPIDGYTLGVLEYFDEVPADTMNNVGPGENKIILGTKTFNNVTYFIVGNPEYKTTPRLFANNIGIIPVDNWNNESITDPKFKPDFLIGDGTNDDMQRDQLAYTSKVTETIPLQLTYGVMGNFMNSSDFLSATLCKSTLVKVKVGGDVKVSGNYHFNVSAAIRADVKTKSWQHILLAARLVVERKGVSYGDIVGYSERGFSYFDTLGWDIGEKRFDASNIVRNSNITLMSLLPGDKVYLEIMGECRSKGQISFSLEAGVSSDSTFLVSNDVDSQVDGEIYSGLEVLLKRFSWEDATTNLHFNGKIELAVNTDVIKKGNDAIPPSDIPVFYEKDSVITPSSILLNWDAPKDKNIKSYDVQYVISSISPDKDYRIESDYLWRPLGSTTNKNAYTVSIDSITKGLTSDNYYVWFRIAPRSTVRGNWSGGYWRFTLNKLTLRVDEIKYAFVGSGVDPVSDLYIVDDRAKDPALGSWGTGACPADDDDYEFAIDYSDFRGIDPEGKGYVHGISPGIHSLYVRRRTTEKYLYAKQVITIAQKVKFEDLELTTSIDMKLENQNISNFDVQVTVHDPSNPYGSYNIYLSPYDSLDINNLPVIPDATIPADTLCTITVLQKMAKTGNLHIYATIAGDRDTMYQNGLEYQSERQIGNTLVYYKRIVKGTILISEDQKNDRYNLEIGTFPSPFYGHKTGTLINVYQPLQNLDSGAFITNEIKLSGNAYVDIEVQPVYDGSMNIIFTDGEKVPRVINTGFSILADNQYELIQRNGGKESNKYNTNTVEVSSRLVQTENSVLGVSVQSVNNSGGHLEVGSYKLLFKLSTVDGNETDVVAETGNIPIFFGETLGSIQGGPVGAFTHKSIDLLLTDVDSYFNHVSVYVHHATGVNQLIKEFYKVDYQYLIRDLDLTKKTTDVNITLTGFEPIIKIDMDQLTEQKMPIASIKTLAQVQNRLFVANFTHEDIDYNQLFQVGTSILVTPAFGNDKAQLSDIMENWPSESEDLQTFSSNFLNESLKSFTSADLNTENISDLKDMIKFSRSQGYHNPMFVEKYAAYWPKETYVFNVSFVSKDNFITRPVPVVGGDFIDQVYNVGVQNNDALIRETFNVNKTKFENSTCEPWQTFDGISFNTMGVLRFPKQTRPNQVFFPKFTFDINDFNKYYPGFIEKFKGFFFTRAERKPDIIMQGFIGPVLSTLTDMTVIQDANPINYVPNRTNEIPVLNACVPALYSGLGILAFEHSVSTSTPKDDLNWGIESEDQAGAFVTNMAYVNTTMESYKTSYKDNYTYDINSGKVPVYKNWFKSGDIFSDFVQAATDFNGKSYGIQLIAGIDGNTISQYTSDNLIIPFLEDSETTSSESLSQMEHVLQALKSSKTITALINTTYKITPDYRGYGSNSRSPGGFSSMIPFRSLGRIFKNNKNQDIITYLTGVFTAYVGLSSPVELTQGFYDVYSGSEGYLSGAALRVMYSVNSNNQHIAITPRYLFENYLGKRSINVYATRGDCFITTSIHNIARSLPAVSGNPSSSSTKFKASLEKSNEPNSYRGSSASMSIMATHASNYLNYARHTEVVDEKESASYGGPRTFLPLSGTIDSMICISHGAKQTETTAFNKGYADNFLGKRYFSISGTSPYYTKKGANTVAFSGAMTRDSFFNAFRDFDLIASKTYGSEMGSIYKLIEFRNNLIAVHSEGVYQIGVNDRQLVNNDQNNKIYASATDVLAEKPIPLSSKLGTKFPRSVEKSDRFVYGIDANRGKIWRTDGASFEIISDNIVESLLKGFLYEMKGLDEVPGERYIASFYEPAKREMVFSIYNKDSQHPNFELPMPPDIYFFLQNLYKAGIQVSANDQLKAKDLLYHWANDDWYGYGHHINHLLREDRLRYVELYLEAYLVIIPEMDSKICQCMTLVYSEDLKIWVTRWSVAPEFMFHHSGVTYSIANKQDTLVLPDSMLSFVQDVEAKLVAGYPNSEDVRINSSLYDPNDNLRRLIWRHEGFNPSIPIYGSFYGKNPVFELAFVVADQPTKEKTFETLSIVGSHSTPSLVIYTMSDDNPLLNKVMSTTDFSKYLSWDGVEDAYFDEFGSYSKKSVIYPAMFFKQYVRDRRFNTISRANALYSQGRFDITISKGMQPMFINQSDWERMRFRYFQDKAIKIRLRYESGEEIKVHTVLTTFSY